MRLIESSPVGVAFVSSIEFSINEFVLSQGVYGNFLTPSEDSTSQGGWGGGVFVLCFASFRDRCWSLPGLQSLAAY